VNTSERYKVNLKRGLSSLSLYRDGIYVQSETHLCLTFRHTSETVSEAKCLLVRRCIIDY